MVKFSLSTSEMNGDNITIVCSDAAGLEWCDMIINLQTVLRKFDDLAFPNTAGNGIDVTATGGVGIDWSNVENPTSAVSFTNTIISLSNVVATNGAQAGGANTITLAVAGSSAIDDTYKGETIWIASGTGAGQARVITAYNGTTKVATVSPNWVTNPAAASGYVIFAAGSMSGIVPGAITSAAFAAGAIDAAAIAADAIGASELATDAVTEIVNALNAAIIEGSLTLKDVLRLILAAETGKSSGGGTTSVAFRDNADTKNRISATVTSVGNRTAVTLDAS